jgi:isocitrate dehydrogenase (NAD+)
VVIERALQLADEAGAAVDWQLINAPITSDEGEVSLDLLGEISEAQVALSAPFTAPIGVGLLSPIVQLRKQLDLFAGVRYIRHLRGLESRYQDLDFVIVRENTEDVYAGLEHTVYPGVVESIKVVTQRASERVARFVYQLAADLGRSSVAIVYKANIMKRSDGLFFEIARIVGAEVATSETTSQIKTRELIVDNACMQMVMWPEQFEVILCGNLYGDILSDLGAGLVGGGAATWGEDHGERVTLFSVGQRHVSEHLEPSRDLVGVLMPIIALLRRLGQGEASAKLLSVAERLVATESISSPSSQERDQPRVVNS